MSDAQLKYTTDKERSLSHLNLQSYHPSLVDSSKFTLSDTNKTDGNLISGLHSNLFALNTISSQYAKGMDLATLHESLNRAQTTIEESQNIRVKHLFSMTNNDNVPKQFSENRDAPKNHSSMNNDRNNNNNNSKNSSNKDKSETTPQFKEFEPPAEKSSQNIHTNSKSGVSLKCAYCEAREDFKSR